jgi:hypothetical protein
MRGWRYGAEPQTEMQMTVSCGRRAGGGDAGGGVGGAGGCEREQKQSGKGKSDERELEIVRRLQVWE